jgi:hypothetical protein
MLTLVNKTPIVGREDPDPPAPPSQTPPAPVREPEDDLDHPKAPVDEPGPEPEKRY